MHPMLYLYLLEGTNTQQLRKLVYPLSDGTQRHHVEFAIALRNNKTTAPLDDPLSQQIFFIHKSLNENENSSPYAYSNSAFSIALGRLKEIKPPSHDIKYAIVSCYNKLGMFALMQNDNQLALSYFIASKNYAEKIKTERDQHWHEIAKTYINLTFCSAENSATNNNRADAKLAEKYFRQALAAYKRTRSISPDERLVIAKSHILIGNINDYFFNGMTDNISTVTHSYFAAIEEILIGKKISIEAVDQMRIAFAKARNRYFTTDFSYYFWLLAENCLNNEENTECNLFADFNALIANLLGNKISDDEKRIYITLTIKLIKLLFVVYENGVFPNNDVFKELKSDKNSFNEVINLLEQQQTLKLSTLIKDKYLNPFIENTILTAHQMLAQHAGMIDDLLNLAKQEEFTVQIGLRNEIDILTEEILRTHDEAQTIDIDTVKHYLEQYKKLQKLTTNDYRNISEAEYYVANYYENSAPPLRNIHYALRHFSNALINRSNIDPKSPADWEFFFKCHINLINLITNEAHFLDYPLDTQLMTNSFCYYSLIALTNMNPISEESIVDLTTALANACDFILPNTPYFIFWFTAKQCFLDNDSLNRGQIDILKIFGKLVSSIKESNNKDWRALSELLSSLIKVITKVKPDNSLSGYINNHPNEIEILLKQLAQLSSHTLNHHTKPTSEIYEKQFLVLKQQLTTIEENLALIVTRNSASLQPQNFSFFQPKNIDDKNKQGVKRDEKTDTHTLEKTARTNFLTKKYKK